ncbi:MAG: ribose-5-phosphate isomerase RpiA [Gammaproteobacteria bacterium]
MSSDDQKRAAAVAALEYIDDDMTLGVGTGSTVEHFIAALPQHAGRLSAIVSSSLRTTEQLRACDMEVSELSAIGDIDLYVDGADESTRYLDLIKGGGGALTREKILAGAARRFVCIVDESKVVDRLGAFPLPIEVIPMARSFVARQAIRLGGQPFWREGFITDNGNEILDVRNLDITDPRKLETEFNQVPGVVTVGLFAHRGADVLLIGTDDQVLTLTP